MGVQLLPMIAFNRGLVSRLGLSRQDIKRVSMSAQTMTNWMPRVLGSMMIRPGLKYLGTTKDSDGARFIAFVFSTTQKALLEFSDLVMRVWVNDTPVTRVAVSTAVTNGTMAQYSTTVTISNASPGVVTYTGADGFANGDVVAFTTTGGLPNPLVAGTGYYVVNVNTGANTFEVSLTSGGASINTTTAGSGTHTVFSANYLNGWTDNDESGAVSRWINPGYMQLLGTGTEAAIRDQQVTVAPADIGKEHALEIRIARGPVTLRVGSTSGGDEYIAETTLRRGRHSLAFTPTGDFYIRFLSRLERVVWVNSCTVAAAGPMEITSPYLIADIPLIRSDQSADVVFLACDGYQQMRVERRSTTSWSVVYYEPEDGPFMIENVSTQTMAPSVLDGNGTLTSSIPFFTTGHVGALFSVTSDGQYVTKTGAAANDATDPVRVTGVGTSRAVTYVVSANAGTGNTIIIEQSFDNNIWTTFSTPAVNVNVAATSFNDGLDNQIVYYRMKVSVYAAGSPVMVLSYATGSIRGICRVTGYSSSTVVDMEVLSTFGGTVASDVWEQGAWSDEQGWPSAVSLYEGRLWWAGNDKIDGSVSDGYESFDPNTVGDSGPISRSVGGSQVESIQWLLPLQRLLVGGSGAEYICKSSSLDEILTPTNFNPKRASTQGSATVRAVSVDSQGVFVQRGGTRIFAMSQGDATAGFEYTATNLCQIIPEIGQPGITRIAVQRQPDTRVHCVRSDGTVAILIFDATENVTCWVEYETDGLVKDVVVLPGDSGEAEDHVYYMVRRVINGSVVRYLEKWAFESDCQGGTTNNLGDSYILYSGSPATVITGLSSLEAEQVVVWADGADVGTDSSGNLIYTVSGGQITLAVAASNVMVGLPYTASFESGKLLDLAQQGGTTLNQVKAIRHLGLVMADVHAKGLTYGPSLTDTMYDLPGVEEGAPVDPDAIRTEYDENMIEFPGKWSTDARLAMKAVAPRPVTVLSAVMEVETT